MHAVKWLRNEFGAPAPLIVLGLFQAGVTHAVDKGDMLERTADTNTRWARYDSNAARTADFAIAHETIKSGDRAGFYELVVPRPGDVFLAELSAEEADVEIGDSLYFNSHAKLQVAASGTAIATVVGQHHYPPKQGHASDDASGDSGESIRPTRYVEVAFVLASSFYAALFK